MYNFYISFYIVIENMRHYNTIQDTVPRNFLSNKYKSIKQNKSFMKISYFSQGVTEKNIFCIK